MNTPVIRHAKLEIVPLGGLGQFGMNTMFIKSEQTSILIDAGVMFPDEDSFGIGVIIPSLSYLRETAQRLAALVLTHGHEDHIGGVPYAWDLLDGPVLGSPLTLALLENKLKEKNIDPKDRLTPVSVGETFSVGSIAIEFISVSHSMPDCAALALHTQSGIIIHTGDYKLDNTPLSGKSTDTQRLATLGRSGVLAMLGDSTNAERQGFTKSETDVAPALRDIFESTQGLLVVATFSSSLHRIQLLVNLAVEFGRKLVVVGRGLVQNIEIALKLGYLSIPAGLQIKESKIGSMPRKHILCLVTGSQGEPFSGLSRIAADYNRHIKLETNDAVVFSARAIPGNQRAIGRVIDEIARCGADIIQSTDTQVHVSGHGSLEEMRLMLTLLKPKYFVPIHGNYRNLLRHAQLAESILNQTSSVFLIENGDRLCFDSAGAWQKEAVSAGQVLIDKTRSRELTNEVFSERRRLAGQGIVIVTIAIDTQTRSVIGEPVIVTRGIPSEPETSTLHLRLKGIIKDIVQSSSCEEIGTNESLEELIRAGLQKHLRKYFGQRPLVLPIVMET